MTNLEKIVEVFGNGGLDGVKVTPEWADKEYKEPIVISDYQALIGWLNKKNIRFAGTATRGLRIYDKNDEFYMLLTDFDMDKGKVYVEYKGLTGWKSIYDVKYQINEHNMTIMNKKFAELFKLP